MYFGVPASVPISTLEAHCSSQAAAAACDAVVIRINPGRFHVRTLRAAANVTLDIADAAANARSRILLLRSRVRGQLFVDSGSSGEPVVFDVPAADVRSVFRRPDAMPAWGRITFVPAATNAPIVIDEIGWFERDDGLLRGSRPLLGRTDARNFYELDVVLFTLAVCGFVVVVAWLSPDYMRRFGPWVLGILCVFVCLLEIATNYSPFWKYDLRPFYASEVIESGNDGNLTGGLFAGVRFFEGKGLTVPPNNVQWHRMPGYSFLSALVATITRTSDVVELAMRMVVVQVVLYAVCVGVFVATAPRLFGVFLTYLIGTMIVLLPKQLHYTQVDSIIAPVSVLVGTALIVYLAETDPDEAPSLGMFLLVNAPFALWFLLRNDVLPGWLIVTAVIARRRLALMIIPVAVAATIAVAWGLYKRPYRQEFNLMPTNTGEVMFLSLCEVPGTFQYACTDDGYANWITRASHAEITSQVASDVGVREVIRYWFTYPVHFVFMLWTKFMSCIHEQFWSGFFTRFNKGFSILRDSGVAVYLLVAVWLSLILNYERRRSFFLGWVLFFNMPLFFIVYASAGRFYPPSGASLLLAATPLILDSGFYKQLYRRRWHTAVALLCVAAFALTGGWIDSKVRTSDTLHYWAPLLDPRASTIAFPPPLPAPR